MTYDTNKAFLNKLRKKKSSKQQLVIMLTLRSL
jgi:hypothetical protein